MHAVTPECTTTPGTIDAGWMLALEALGPDLTVAQWAARIGCSEHRVRVALRLLGQTRGRGPDRKPRGPDALTWAALGVLREAPLSGRAVARRLGCDPKTALARLRALETRGKARATPAGWVVA